MPCAPPCPLQTLLTHMMETLRQQTGGGGGGLGLPTGGGLGGLVGGLVSSFLLGPAAMGGQTPVLCSDKPIDLYTTMLHI
jgi:hypothetical protein